jgi:hypothetical protein
MPIVEAQGFQLKNEYGLVVGPADDGWPWVSGQTPNPNQESFFNQQYSLLSSDLGDSFAIVNLGVNQLGNNTVLDVPTHGWPYSASSLGEGTRVQLYPLNTGSNQLWFLRPVKSDAPSLSVQEVAPQGNWWIFQVLGESFAKRSEIYVWLLGEPLHDGSPALFPPQLIEGNVTEPLGVDKLGGFQMNFFVQQTVDPGVPANNGFVTVVATDPNLGDVLAVATCPNSAWFGQ